jgi:hypothetical protein
LLGVAGCCQGGGDQRRAGEGSSDAGQPGRLTGQVGSDRAAGISADGVVLVPTCWCAFAFCTAPARLAASTSARRSSPSRPARRATRTIAALLALRDQVIGPILAGVRSPRLGRKPAHWTAVDRDYETLRIGMQSLFADLGITTAAPQHRQPFVDPHSPSA